MPSSRDDRERGEAGANERAGGDRVARLSAYLRRLRRDLLDLRDEHAIYELACRAAVETGQFRFAWLGIADPSTDTMRPVAQYGQGDGYLDAITIPLGTGGPTASALREREPVVCADISEDARMTPWRDEALTRHFRSSGAFPIARGGEPFGTLNVYSADRGFADPLERYLLEATAEEIGVALDALDHDRARADADQRLAEREQSYRAIFEAASDGIFIANATGGYLDVNPAGCALLGYTREELLARSIGEIIAPEDLVEKPLALARLEPDRSFIAERRLRRKDGIVIDAEIHGTKLPDGRLQSIVRDVSERKRIVAERTANERMASLGRLAQAVGHEINNPLAYLTLSLEHARCLLRGAPEQARAGLEAALAQAEDGAARIARIVRALATFGRGDSETVAPTQVSRAVDAALALTANRLKYTAKVEVDIASATVVLANEFQLTQVLVNLLLNAADAMEEVAREQHVVRIVARTEPNANVVIEVSDSGPGIPAANRERIFDPFFTTKLVGRGTGIGLSISRGIVATFGGTLSAAAAESGGALFRLTLKQASVGSAQATPRASHAAGPRLRVLIVDDEPLLRRTLARTLARHDVTVLDAVAPAIELCMREDFDRIVCDLMFPQASGEALYTALEERRPELARRIVFMTGGAFTPGARAFLERVGLPCLTKPFSGQDLEAAVSGAIRADA